MEPHERVWKEEKGKSTKWKVHGCAIIGNKNELLYEKHRERNTVLKMLQLKSVEWNETARDEKFKEMACVNRVRGRR
jgi:hypothetical protein